jgi:hypothetical protein
MGVNAHKGGHDAIVQLKTSYLKSAKRGDAFMDEKKRFGASGKNDDDKPNFKKNEIKSGGSFGSRAQTDDDDDKPRAGGAARAGSGKRDDDDNKPRAGAAAPAKFGGGHLEITPEIQTQLDELKSRLQDYISRVNLTDVASRITDLASKVNLLPNTIQAVRSRGYTFRSYLESKATVLAQQFKEAQGVLNTFLKQEAAELRKDLDRAEKMFEDLQARRASESVLSSLTDILDNLKAKIEAAEEHVSSLVSTLEREIGLTDSQLHEVNWVLEQKEGAGFQFFAGESVYAAAQAEWDNGSNKPDGILFLTDQRLVFEQKENVGGGLFRKGEFKQEVLWEVPLSTIQEVKNEDKGLFGGKDLVHLKMREGRHNAITVEIKGGIDSKVWSGHIQRVQTGGAEGERTVQADPQLKERLRSAPTQCPTCGATLPTVMAGQNEIKCIYCNTGVRL